MLEKIKYKIKKCLVRLYRENPNLFDRNNSNGLCERCLVFRFGLYLQGEFLDYFVDCDFNSSFVNGSPTGGKQIANSDGSKTKRFVDIIVHQRKAPPNTDFICFEIKKWNNRNAKAAKKDMNNLVGLTSEFGYQYGFYLILGRNLRETKWIIFHRNRVPEVMEPVFS